MQVWTNIKTHLRLFTWIFENKENVIWYMRLFTDIHWVHLILNLYAMLYKNIYIALLKTTFFKCYLNMKTNCWNVSLFKKSRTKYMRKGWLYLRKKTSNNAYIIISYYAPICNYYFSFYVHHHILSLRRKI